MYHGPKADLLKKLDVYVEDTIPSSPKSALVIDMAHIIHAKSFADIETFGDFALAVYFTLERLGEDYDRWDLVFDQYKNNSLKAATRKQRGSGSLYKFTEDTPLPKKMQETFLKNAENKNELNLFLAKQMIKLHRGAKTLVATFKDSVLVLPSIQSAPLHSSSIGTCQSEEADQRVVRHALQCMSDANGFDKVVVRTGDTDVVVLCARYVAMTFGEETPKQIYVHMVSTNSHRLFNIKEVVKGLGVDVCLALSWFYAFTGCDTVSSFYGK